MWWFIIIFCLLLPTACVQFAVYLCQKKWPVPFNKISWWLLCVVPASAAILLKDWIFLSFCIGFAVVSLIGYLLARQNPLSPTTPRFVYKWFHTIGLLTLALNVLSGLIAIVSLFISLCFDFPDESAFLINLGGALGYYGGYFGLISRDLAIIITETMNNKPGLFRDAEDLLPTGSVKRDCCNICKVPKPTQPSRNRFDFIQRNSATKDHEKWKKLKCGDIFHESCLRGWVMLGKKTTCPCCREKVDFQLDDDNSFFGRFETNLLFGYDIFLRYAIVYLPIIFFLFFSLILLVGA